MGKLMFRPDGQEAALHRVEVRKKRGDLGHVLGDGALDGGDVGEDLLESPPQGHGVVDGQVDGVEHDGRVVLQPPDSRQKLSWLHRRASAAAAREAPDRSLCHRELQHGIGRLMTLRPGSDIVPVEQPIHLIGAG